MKALTAFLAILLLSLSSFAAMFGKDQIIHIIEPDMVVPFVAEDGVPFVDEQGNPITGKLAYLTEIQFFFAGVYITDQGYVIKGVEEGSFYNILPEEQAIIEQQIGKPFPPYDLSIIDYLFGYSLWLIIIGMGVYYFLKWGFGRMRGEGS